MFLFGIVIARDVNIMVRVLVRMMVIRLMLKANTRVTRKLMVLLNAIRALRRVRYWEYEDITRCSVLVPCLYTYALPSLDIELTIFKQK